MLTRTTTDLLERLEDPANDEVWTAFDQRFRPIVIGMGRRLGLTEDDAADAAQETLTRFLTAYRAGKYDRDRGRLGGWITGIARHCIADLHRARAARREHGGVSSVPEPLEDDHLMAAWSAECEQEILRRGLDELRRGSRTDPRTIEAFELVAFEQQRPADVAERLELSVNEVYLAKHRCLKRLREIVRRLEETYETGHPPALGE